MIFRGLVLDLVLLVLGGLVALIDGKPCRLVSALFVHNERSWIYDLRGHAIQSSAPQIGLEVAGGRVFAASDTISGFTFA